MMKIRWTWKNELMKSGKLKTISLQDLSTYVSHNFLSLVALCNIWLFNTFLSILCHLFTQVCQVGYSVSLCLSCIMSPRNFSCTFLILNINVIFILIFLKVSLLLKMFCLWYSQHLSVELHLSCLFFIFGKIV